MLHVSPRLCLAAIALLSALGPLTAADRSASAMATAATKFLASLTPEQQGKAALPFEGDERFKWHFVPAPPTFERRGLLLKDMNEAQRKLAHDMLKSGLSQRGYLTASSIIDLETVLGALEAAQRASVGRQGGGINRDPERYFFTVFGRPSPRGAWGWRVEGHHVSLHFTVVNGSLVASSPAFFGSNPAEVREGPKRGLRILGAEEDAARALVQSLDGGQRAKAMIDTTAPSDMVTMADVDIKPLSPTGIGANVLTPSQRDLRMTRNDAYTGLMAPDIAADRMARLKKAGVDNIAFAWAGPIERGQKHYYRIQGPTFLVEYDNTQNDGNHIHSVWRDFQGDFGRDLLREHLKTASHP